MDLLQVDVWNDRGNLVQVVVCGVVRKGNLVEVDVWNSILGGGGKLGTVVQLDGVEWYRERGDLVQVDAMVWNGMGILGTRVLRSKVSGTPTLKRPVIFCPNPDQTEK